jgi:hypothetical protein
VQSGNLTMTNNFVNVIEAEVTAPDGLSISTYTVSATRGTP